MYVYIYTKLFVFCTSGHFDEDGTSRLTFICFSCDHLLQLTKINSSDRCNSLCSALRYGFKRSGTHGGESPFEQLDFSHLELSEVIGIAPVIIHFSGTFHEINHPASLGYPHDELETPRRRCVGQDPLAEARMMKM